MKKGIAPVVIGFVVVMLIVFGIIVAFATNAAESGIARKHLFEASLISESDKVETYARSFLVATDLSLIQSMYNTGNGEIVMPYDLNAYYSQTYNLPFWQISTDSVNTILIPPNRILNNKFRQEISWAVSCYVDNYFEVYKNFAGEQGFVLTGTPIAKVDYILNDRVRVQTTDIQIHRKNTFEDKTIEIDRMYKPFSEIYSKFGNTTEEAEKLIRNDEIGKCIRDATGVCAHTKTDRADTQKALNNLAFSLSTVDVNYTFNILEFQASGSDADVIVNVSIFDNTKNYTLYALKYDKVVIGFSGVEFLVLVYKTGDEAWANSKYGPASNIVKQCPSSLNLISPRDANDICTFFDVSPSTCQDTDGGLIYTTAGTCADFTGSYGDLCFDLDRNGADETLYEYACHSSNVCNFTQRFCRAGCVSNACNIGCNQNPDCAETPNNMCTQDICQNPGGDDSYCENPPEPTSTTCGTRTRDCSSSNCACEGDDWMCETDTDKTCTRYCDGAGGCGDCTPTTCDKVDRGCCADSDCPATTPLCHLPTHTCYRCLTDSDCPQDGYYCNGNTREQRNYYCNPGPGDCGYTVTSSENCNGYDGSWCNGNTRETRDYSCSGAGPSASCGYSVSATEDCNSYDKYYCYNTNIREYRDWSCSGAGPSSSCSYSYSDRKTCDYNCKDDTNCWRGFLCIGSCSHEDTGGLCTGTSSCSINECRREDNIEPAPTCTYYTCYIHCCCLLRSGCLCIIPCGAECCWDTPATCNSVCILDESCTYS